MNILCKRVSPETLAQIVWENENQLVYFTTDSEQDVRNGVGEGWHVATVSDPSDGGAGVLIVGYCGWPGELVRSLKTPGEEGPPSYEEALGKVKESIQEYLNHNANCPEPVFTGTVLVRIEGGLRI